MREKLIAPSVLSCDFARLSQEIERCNKAAAGAIHIDVMDGHFVPNITIGSAIVATIKSLTSIPLDCHLMIAQPDRYIADFIKAGADMVTVHCEATPHLHRTLSAIKQYGAKAGVALNPLTPLAYAFEAAEYADFIVLMSVNPGFGGQSFIPGFLPRCRALRQHLDAKKETEAVAIEVDGGINADNLESVIEAGVDIIVSGSGLFQGDFAKNMARFKKIAEKTTTNTYTTKI